MSKQAEKPVLPIQTTTKPGKGEVNEFDTGIATIGDKGWLPVIRNIPGQEITNAFLTTGGKDLVSNEIKLLNNLNNLCSMILKNVIQEHESNDIDGLDIQSKLDKIIRRMQDQTIVDELVAIRDKITKLSKPQRKPTGDLNDDIKNIVNQISKLRLELAAKGSDCPDYSEQLNKLEKTTGEILSILRKTNLDDLLKRLDKIREFVEKIDLKELQETLTKVNGHLSRIEEGEEGNVQGK